MAKRSIIFEQNQEDVITQVIATSGAANPTDAVKLVLDNVKLLLCAGINIHEKSIVTHIIKLNSKE